MKHIHIILKSEFFHASLVFLVFMVAVSYYSYTGYIERQNMISNLELMEYNFGLSDLIDNPLMDYSMIILPLIVGIFIIFLNIKRIININKD